MNKKFKWAIPFAVLSLSCGVAAGVFAGCNTNKHTHSYTKWQNNGDGTCTLTCPDDGAKDTSTTRDHVFVGGECDCGAEQQIVAPKYGSVKGSVRLYKQGAYVDVDSAGVTVSINSDAQVSGEVKEGKYEFGITNVKINEEYTLTISKNGYETKEYTIELEEEGEEIPIGGSNGITLNYQVFTTFLDFDMDLHDFSHVNDANPTIGVNGELNEKGEGKKTLDVLTTDKYDDVSVTIKAKASNAGVIQGLVLKFEDGKVAWVNIKTDQDLVQFRPNNADWKVQSIYGDTWKESAPGTVTQTHKDKFNGDGVDVTLVRKGGDMYVYVDGGLVYSVALPEGYEDDKVQAGLFALSVKPNAVWEYTISDTLPEMGETTVDIDVDRPSEQEAAACDVTADKDKYVWGTDDTVTLTVTEATDYKLERLLVNGNDLAEELVNGKLTVKADRAVITVKAEFVKAEPIVLNLTVKGKKIGKTENLAEGTTVTFKGTAYSFVVGTDGVISGSEIPKGKYTVVVNGYFEKQIVLDETLDTVELEYDLFKVVNYDGEDHDFTHGNEADGYIAWKGSLPTMNAVSKENMLGTTATITVHIKGGTSKDTSKEQGIIMRFEDGKVAAVNINVDSVANARLQFRPNVCDRLYTAFDRDWLEYKNVTPEEVAKYNSDEGIVLKAVRDGNYIYVFIDDVYHATAILGDAYADDAMGFGFYCFGVQNPNAEWHFTVSETAERAAATVTDKTAAGAHGDISGIPATAKVGDEVTLTVTAETDYKLLKLFVGGVDVTAQISGKTYKFWLAGDTDVSAEFTPIVYKAINAPIIGRKFGIDGNALTATTATLSASGIDDVTAQITAVGDGFVLTVDRIVAGTWTVSVQGYRSAQITVTETEDYVTEIELKANEEFSLVQPWGNVNSVIAADGSAQLTITNESETAVTATTYGDIAVTATLCTTNMIKDGKVGNQGIVFRFSDNKFIVLRLEHRDKIQFAYTEWYQGESADGTGWQDLIFFTDAGENTQKDKYLTALDEGKLQLTAVRKGATIYAILTVDGVSEIIGSRTFDAKYLNDKAKVGMYVGDSANGPDKTWAFAVGDADAKLAEATHAVGADKVSYLGSWTENEGKLGVKGKGLVEFAEQTGTFKESVTIHVAAANATNEQGIIYRFADGKYVAIRYQNSTEAATPNGKVQFTMDTVFYTNASLIGWGSDYALSEEEKTAFDGDGLDLTLVRDGNKFYVVLGGRLLGTQTVDEGAYATANGNMGIMIWDGKEGAEFTYSHATGDDVVVPVTVE